MIRIGYFDFLRLSHSENTTRKGNPCSCESILDFARFKRNKGFVVSGGESALTKKKSEIKKLGKVGIISRMNNYNSLKYDNSSTMYLIPYLRNLAALIRITCC